ncbi:HEAT repeat domain-containing protein [Photobacterium atrarenae]|uniref:HEAT repeat domain-containing protein n=1 Tax=Photobacterium atrarenae TaxID=865757 RepID=A0ABY5GL83_9GAMM|nr:HEAT repeat domain-containing protein [Photobacterium atrarenae]UTV30080.1 HEAT repeat domain-containing protein [Photobacterium atrarenae]
MKIWLFIQAATLESYGIHLLLGENWTATSWSSLIAVHTIACASCTMASWLMLPGNYRASRISTVSFLFAFHFLLPVVGMLGTSCALLLGLHFPRKQHHISWQQSEALALPQSPGDILTNTPFGSGALRDILVHNDDPGQRSLAVSAICHLPRQQSVPLLQLALKDLSDDVRLLAYAALEGIESEINDMIASHKKSYAQHHNAQTSFEIAQQYWELCYLGIAEGILKKHYLEQAEYYLNQSVQNKQRASSSLLLGRVLLVQQRPEEAVPYLTYAMENGLRTTQVAPYLAEAAYRVKDYRKVRKYLAYFPTQQGEVLSQIKEHWL